jgi:hypothetical protein
MNTLQILQSSSMPVAEQSPPTMNVTIPTKKNKKPPQKRMQSGALMRRDQDMKGHARLGVVGDERTSPKGIGRYGEFGTIGAKLTRPTR